MDQLQELISNKETFFKFMGNFFPVYYKSNIFMRDVQFAIKNYFDQKKIKLSYTETENLALQLMNNLVEKNEAKILKENKSWEFLINLK